MSQKSVARRSEEVQRAGPEAIARAVRRRGWRVLPHRLGRANGRTPLGVLSVCPACETRSLWILPVGRSLARGALWCCLDGCEKSRVLDALALDAPELLALPEAEDGDLARWRALFGPGFLTT